MRRLANLKHSSSETRSSNGNSTKRSDGISGFKAKKSLSGKNKHGQGDVSVDAVSGPDGVEHSSPLLPYTGQSGSVSAYELRNEPTDRVREEQHHPAPSGRSTAATGSTEPGTIHSDVTRSMNAESSGAGTSGTVGGDPSSKDGAGSTFSSRAASERSLTTTLTTVQSIGPTSLLPAGANGVSSTNGVAMMPPHSAGSNIDGYQGVPFSHQFPSSPPASAIPSHLAPHSAGGNPTTYSAATANNLLTDNASILTLASSSKRHRRHSLDTNASVRALAPSSVWGGSRESLPLSVLSGNVGDLNYAPTPGLQHSRPSVSGVANAERASVYSASGIAPALSSDRNSVYAGKPNTATGGTEGGSMKSGFPGHGRNDSVTGSIGGASLMGSASLSVASPRESSFGVSAMTPGRASRRSSGWADVGDGTMDGPERQESRKASLHGIAQGSEA